MNIENIIDDTAEHLINKNAEKYEIGTTDYGYYNNGVGMACCGKETVYDEEQAKKDAKNLLLQELDSLAGKSDQHIEGWLEDIFQVEEVYNYVKNLIMKG